MGGQVHGAVVQSLNVLQRGIAGVAGNPVGIGRHESESAVTHREDGEETVAGQKDRQLILRYLSGQVEVAKDVVMRQRPARERQPERLADHAVCAVGGDQIGRVEHFLGAVTAAQHGRDAVAVLGTAVSSTPRSILTPCRFSCSVSSRSVSDWASSST